jgi:hypothetical protein
VSVLSWGQRPVLVSDPRIFPIPPTIFHARRIAALPQQPIACPILRGEKLTAKEHKERKRGEEERGRREDFNHE